MNLYILRLKLFIHRLETRDLQFYPIRSFRPKRSLWNYTIDLHMFVHLFERVSEMNSRIFSGLQLSVSDGCKRLITCLIINMQWYRGRRVENFFLITVYYSTSNVCTEKWIYSGCIFFENTYFVTFIAGTSFFFKIKVCR